MAIGRVDVISLLAGMQDGEIKFNFIKFLYDRGEVDDEKLYDLLSKSIERNPRYYFEQITNNDLLTFIWRRFQAYPEALARALATACPEIFYGNQEWVTRLVIRLQSDMKLGAELGMITIPPIRGGMGTPRTIQVDESLLEKVPREVMNLDVDCRVRELLYWYSRDRTLGDICVSDEIKGASSEYERRVWKQAQERIHAYLAAEYPGAIETIAGDRMFPALHVRWWLEESKSDKSVLNIADTGAYKTSYGALSMLQAGCERVLILCAPGARVNWQKELEIYFPWARSVGRIHVIESAKDAEWIPRNARFVIVGHSNLVNRKVVGALKDLAIDGLVWDECHYGKNVVGSDPAKRALASMEIIGAHMHAFKKVVALSNTPWENSPAECAALACVLRPDAFTDPEHFLRSGAFASPRFLRALFGTKILDISLHEIRDLPNIEPKPWEDLFGAVELLPTQRQAALYEHVLEFAPEDNGDDPVPQGNGIDASRKVRHLLQAADIPHALARVMDYEWPDAMLDAFQDWQLSAKLRYLKSFLDEHLGKSKVVIGSGLYKQGVTQPVEDFSELIWLGRLLQEWYGEETVLLLDGDVSIGPQRDEVIRRWREDPSARILLVSMRTCPDSINLSVTCRHENVEHLHVIAYSLGWIPWKQFLGRFWREGLSVPMSYRTLIVAGTADEARLELTRRKWMTLVRFRSRVPPTQDEWDEYMRKDGDRLRDLLRSPAEHVMHINRDMRGKGEVFAERYLTEENGLSSNAEIFARSFARIQETGVSGNIARFICLAIEDGLIPAGILDDPARIADIACGPGTMARYLKLPVFGADFNPYMIEVAKELDPGLTENLCLGRMSALPKNWTGKFGLTVCSLALDWTDFDPTDANCGRLNALRELLRVTDPFGLIWITFNQGALENEHYVSWKQALATAGCDVLPLSGRVVPRGQGNKENPDISFWSLLVSPNGKRIQLPDARPFALAFELSRGKVVRGRGKKKMKPPAASTGDVFTAFDILDPLGQAPAVSGEQAVVSTLMREFSRWAAKPGATPLTVSERISALFGNDWRSLQRLADRGVITFEEKKGGGAA